jgi:hypothetical protein
VDWTDSDTEELKIEYKLPKPETPAEKRENRKYFGYIVRVYYKRQLQAATSGPDWLAQQYPPTPSPSEIVPDWTPPANAVIMRTEFLFHRRRFEIAQAHHFVRSYRRDDVAIG